MKTYIKILILIALLVVSMVSISPSSVYSQSSAAPTSCMPISGGVLCFIPDGTESSGSSGQGDETETPSPSPIPHTQTATVTTTPVPPTSTPIPPLQDMSGDFFRSSLGVNGTISSAQWGWVQTALTSSTRPIFGTLIQGRKVLYAQITLAWNPNTDAVPTGVRIVIFDPGPLNIDEVARFDGTNYHSPRGESADITVALQSAIDSGKHKFIGYQTYGNDQNGAIIYSVSLDVVWK